MAPPSCSRAFPWSGSKPSRGRTPMSGLSWSVTGGSSAGPSSRASGRPPPPGILKLMAFPQTRLRRLRATHALRGLVRETRLSPADLVYPLFVAHGIDRREPIQAMPGVDHLSIAHAVHETGEARALGIPAVLLFGLPAAKDEE